MYFLQNGMVDHDLFEKSVLDSIDFSKTPINIEHGINPSNAGENLVIRPLNTEDYEKGLFCYLNGFIFILVTIISFAWGSH